MGWEDRDYYRQPSRSPSEIFLSIINGSVPLFTAFGVRVRVHASLIIFTILTILLDQYSKGYTLHDRIVSMAMLWVVIILHEFGHCFAARSVGGAADDILLWPFGGLAMASPPRRPWPVFVTVICGPLVNALICALCVVAIVLLGGGIVSFNPYNNILPARLPAFGVGYYVFWLFRVSYVLFLFNLVPMYPMDGGQVLQSALWPRFGEGRATRIACLTGVSVAVAMAAYGVFDHLNWMVISIALLGYLQCRATLIRLRESGGEYDIGDIADFSASLRAEAPRRRRRPSLWTIRRLRRQAKRDADEQQRIDDILAKVSAQGMNSLTWAERRALKRATDRQRQFDAEGSRR